MTTQLAEGAAPRSAAAKRLNPVELKIDLLCLGMRIDPGCSLEQARPICARSGDLGGGLELILPGDMMELWVDVPINEKFAAASPYRLTRGSGDYQLHDDRGDQAYVVRMAPNPGWYDAMTRSGLLMGRVGFLSGTLLMVDIHPGCRFWHEEGAELACRYCRKEEDAPTESDNLVDDVVEIALMAQKKSGTTFTMLRGGYDGERTLERVFPYIRALKQKVGMLVGIQFPPETDHSLYDEAHALGIDHFSFRMDFYGQEYYARHAPGKSRIITRDLILHSAEYCVRKNGKGRVAIGLIAGIEPIADTLRAIDAIVGIGALPMVSIFRPSLRTRMENDAAPDPAAMLTVYRHLYGRCREHNLPLGMVPNIHISALPHPLDTLYLAPDQEESRSYRLWIMTMKEMMRPYFLRRMRKQSPPQQP